MIQLQHVDELQQPHCCLRLHVVVGPGIIVFLVLQLTVHTTVQKEAQIILNKHQSVRTVRTNEHYMM
jgi:hypothetical protein